MMFLGDWFDEAKKLKAEGYGYGTIAKKLNKSFNTVKNRFQREKKKELNLPPPTPVKTDNKDILKELQSGCDIETLKTKFGLSERIVKAAIDDLKDEGFDIEEINGLYSIRKVPVEQNTVHSFKLKDGWHKIGVVSDTHLNSKHQQLTHLNFIYDTFESEGVECVFNCGDICAGIGMYKGHEYEVFNIGADAQVEYAIKNYPRRNGIKTKAISGNHDLSFYTKSGIDIIKKLAAERDDIEYLGQYGAYIEIADGVFIYLLHPDSGQAYAISYRPQRIASGFNTENKPDIMLIGHFHQSEYIYERDIHIVQCGSFEGQTPYLKRKGIMPKVGGWVIEFKVDGGFITRFKQEFITFKKEIPNDF